MSELLPLLGIISGLGVALYFIIRSGAKAEVKQDIAEAKVTEITKTVGESNEIEKKNAALSDADLDKRLRDEYTDK